MQAHIHLYHISQEMFKRHLRAVNSHTELRIMRTEDAALSISRMQDERRTANLRHAQQLLVGQWCSEKIALLRWPERP